MTSRDGVDAAELWAGHDRAWRDPAQVASQWSGGGDVDRGLLAYTTRGPWWELLDRLGICLVASREYEHLLVGFTTRESRPHATFMRLPHPSGIAVDRESASLHVASTRNPNQIYELQPVGALLPRLDDRASMLSDRPLVPVGSRYFPGALYLHDLAFVGGVLYGNAVGQNAVVRIGGMGSYERVWWPYCVDRRGDAGFRLNYIQLNSIAAGARLEDSYFSASADRIGHRRPGHRNFPVDGRGVLFGGRTREPVVTGLTRPHSARLHDGRLWVDNSGYGEVGVAVGGRFEPVATLPGWTRGLCFCGDVAFVGVSRVIPRYRSYAPGLDVDASVCGIFALDVRSGAVLASVTWPKGNQVFAVEWLPASSTSGFAFGAGRRLRAVRSLFYTFTTTPHAEGAH